MITKAEAEHAFGVFLSQPTMRCPPLPCGQGHVHTLSTQGPRNFTLAVDLLATTLSLGSLMLGSKPCIIN